VPPETEVLKSIDCPTSEGFLLEDMDMYGSESTDVLVEAEADLPVASVTVTEKDAVPEPDAVHVGFDAEVEEKDPDAPLSDHEYEYGDVPPEAEAVSDTLWPTSIEPFETDADTLGSELTVTVTALLSV
jgi:hypothetical protein